MFVKGWFGQVVSHQKQVSSSSCGLLINKLVNPNPCWSPSRTHLTCAYLSSRKAHKLIANEMGVNEGEIKQVFPLPLTKCLTQLHPFSPQVGRER